MMFQNFRDFPLYLQAYSGIVPQSGHERLLPDNLQLIIHHPITRHSVVRDSYSVVK
jgi:hypothetical protein